MRRDDSQGDYKETGQPLTLFCGIDLTSGTLKPSACVCINATLDVVYRGLLSTDSTIITELHHLLPEVIAIDAPLSLPSGFCCLDEACTCHLGLMEKGRLCERELARLRIPCYFTTKKSIIKEMTERAINLKQEFEKLGYAVIEVYPYASKVRLFGAPIPRKTGAKGLSWLRDRTKLLVNCREVDSWSHDLCDAAIAAYTGFLYVHGEVLPVGSTEEGLLYIPRDSFGRKEIC
jgi:predicted nuclease with RNAse H fold